MWLSIIRWVPVLFVAVYLVAKGNSDHMVNLIISAAVIVLVIFVGVALRRPKS